MATNPNTLPENAGRITAPDANYTYGSAKDDSTGTTGDGTPIKKAILNDIYGFQQWLLTQAGIVPSGNADTVLVSQYGQALIELTGGVGSIVARSSSNVPNGFLECDGSAISRTTYAALFAEIGTLYGIGDGATTFNIPDLRGEFLRGWDNGRGVDAGRIFGSFQLDDFESHVHAIGQGLSATSVGGTVQGAGQAIFNSAPTGGSETRPRNVAMMYCIKF